MKKKKTKTSQLKTKLPFETDEYEEQNKRIYFRSKEDRLLSGVLGGLAVYWKMDSSLLRFLFLLSVLLTGGLMIIVYIILMKIIPEEP